VRGLFSNSRPKMTEIGHCEPRPSFSASAEPIFQGHYRKYCQKLKVSQHTKQFKTIAKTLFTAII